MSPPDFRGQKKRQQKGSNEWYDVDYDRVLIEQSIAKQYGVLPSEQGDLKYSDWEKMVNGLMDDTTLGRVVGVRAETDKEIIKNFTPEQRAIRDEWSNFLSSRAKKDFTEEDKAAWYSQMAELEAAFASAFGVKGK